MPQYFKNHGERLLAHGYAIVPLPPGSKGPNRKGWQHLKLDRETFHRMAANGSANDGAGVLAARVPAIDVDVLDEAVAEEMNQVLETMFGADLLARVGQAPKFLVPFRTDEPFRKLSSARYTDGANDHRLEILGEGQQWVAFHVHPSTGKPYYWGGGRSILDVERKDLPVLTRDDAQKVIEAFEAIAARKVEAGEWWLRAAAEAPSKPATDDPFAAHVEPVRDLSRSDIEALIHKLDYDSRDDWVRAGRILHHQYEGSDEGLEIWNAWAANSSKWQAETEVTVWASFGNRSDAPETLRALIKEFGQPPKPRLPNSGFVPAAQFASSQKVEWHIKHVLPKRGLIVVYGDPGSSKSFFALDMTAHVARGLEWRGHRVRQSKVAYIAAEGVAGFGNRLAAYSKHHEVELADMPIFVRGGAFELKEDYLAACDEINGIGGVGIVVIDTLAAVTPGGNENTSEDMGAAIDAAQKIIQATGASVILIHHTNNQGALRGWSGLKAAVDNLIRIERKDGLRTAHIEKQKEGAEGPPVGYRLKVVDLYTDEDGDPVTSCVVVPDEETAPNTSGQRKERKPRSGDFETSRNYDKARHFLRVIQDMCGLETGVSLQEDEVIAAIQNDPTVNPMAEPDYPPKKNIVPTLRTLCQLGKISKEGRNIRLC